MKKGLRKVLRITGIAVGAIVVLLAAVILLALFDKPLVRNISQKYIAKSAGMDIKVGKLDYTLFPLHVTLSAVTATYKAPNYRLDVTADRIEARGNLRKLLKGVKPAFETIEIAVAELRFNQTKISEVPIDFATLIPMLGGILGYAERTSLTCRAMPIAVPGQTFRADDLSLVFSRTTAANAFETKLDARRFAAAMTPGGPSIDAPIHAEGILTLASPAAANLRLGLDSPTITSGGRTDSVKSLAVEIDGAWRMAENKISLRKLSLDIPDVVNVAATLDGDFGKAGSMEAGGDVRFEKLEALVPHAAPYLPAAFRGLALRGGAVIEAKYSQPPLADGKPAALDALVKLTKVGLTYEKDRVRTELGLAGIFHAVVSSAAGAKNQHGQPRPMDAANSSVKPRSIEATLEFDRVSLDISGQGPALHLDLSGTAKAAGTFPDIRATADIRASTGPIAASGATIKGSTLHLQAAGTKDAVDISGLDVSVTGPSLAVTGGKKIAFDKAELAGSGRADLAGKSFVLTGLEARLPGLAPVRLSGRFDAAPGGIRQVRLESKGQKVPAVRALLVPFMPAALAKWDFDGAADLVLDAKSGPGPGAGWEFSGELKATGAKFNDEAFTIASDGIEPTARISGTIDPVQHAVNFTTTIELSKGESLWKNFYVSWSKFPLKAVLAGRYDSAASSVDGLTATMTLPGLGEVHVSGSARLTPAPALQIKIGGRLGIDPLYSLYSQSGAPPESRMKVAGDVTADLDINSNADGMSVDGRVNIAGASVESPAAKSAVDGLAVELPVHVRLARAAGSPKSKSAPVSETEDSGSIAIKEFLTPSVILPLPTLVIHSRTNAYRVEPFAVELFGSRVEVGEISLSFDPAGGAIQGATSLKLADLDLSRLPAASPKFPLTGHVAVDLPELKISREAIAVTGRAVAAVFGGKVIVRDIAVANPLDKGRSISCNIDIVDLDLGKVTDIVPFGEVTGIVDGEVKGLTISYGQPESFEMRFESKPRKGVAQTFSLKAVDNLTVLSSGERASGGSSQFWMRFVRGFRYAKLGIVSTLKNDTFTLNGTIHEGGVEYLVKKPAFFGINVINRMPDKKVSFKEMMSRLERVGGSESPTVTKKIR